ncbi:MAG: beta-N-acetylglucosaminidase domain-containing protein, partial [Chitinophagaceae bacterium]
MKKSKLFFSRILFLLFFLVHNSLNAQESTFDLSGQRSELQNIQKVTGMAIDHKGLLINPTPHKINMTTAGVLQLSKGVVLKDKKKIFTNDLNFLKLTKKGILFNIDFGTDIATKSGVKNTSGAYVLEINHKGIHIIGYDERGAYYGIQTLRQIIESQVSANGNLPYIKITDYPDMKYRGVVEGFYGPPWSHQVRMSLIDFYGKFKLNSYLYGPKDDIYHSSPNWRLPYPEKEEKNIGELVQACKRNRVDFVWAIHPGKDIKWNEEDYKNLICKFEIMYGLGVRSFAIFFDDIEGEGTNPEKQIDLLNRINKEFVKAKGDVNSLVMCPTDYSKLWANPTPQGSLAKFGNRLDSSIDIFWTGDVVCSDLTKETMDFINSRIKRPAYYWWNYPVTDYVRHILMQGPVYGLDTSLTVQDITGFASNPMEHGEASKLALYSVADYTWNMSEYNPMDSWERALAEIATKAREVYRTFAIHSADTETGYRRSESWETDIFRINHYSQKQFDILLQEYDKIEKVPEQMEKLCSNKALLQELRPWLVEFGKLGNRGKKALELIQIYNLGSDADFWNTYVKNLMNEEQRKAYNTHKSGTMKLHPFYENTMDDLAFNFYTKIVGD